jgi:DNA-binding SARP family transcriptional activator
VSELSDASSAAAPAAASTVPLRLLGQPQLVLGDVVHALERKDAALLALLALEGVTDRERAASLLWPEAESSRARANLRQRLHRLRRQAGFDLVLGSDELSLAVAAAHDLQALSARVPAEPHLPDGELLGTLDYADCGELAAWVDAARERWRAARREALSTLAADLQRQDRVAAALACAERLVRDDPAFEAAHRMLMRLHLRRGDRAAALAAYERCREALSSAAGAVPDAETRALHLQALRGAGDVRPRVDPAVVLRPPRLVGRDAERQQLARAWAEHRVVMLLGEPGIGKTRLLTDFAAAQPGRIVVGGRPGDAHNAYALLARLVRALLPHVTGPLPDWVEAQLGLLLPERGGAAAKSWSPVRLRQALVDVVARTAGDVQGVLVDDLQFCDAASLELLTTVCLEADPRAPNWLFAARAGELTPALSAWVSATGRERLDELRLRPLDLAGVRALLDSLALEGVDAEALAASLYRQSGGNPMFMLETLRAAGGAAPSRDALAAPPQVDELIQRRLARLSGAGLGLAHVAALAGQDFDAALAAAVLGCHALDLSEPWRELEAAHVISQGAFAHDLIFEATQRSVPEARAIDWHARIAAWLEQHGGEPSRVALHWKAARCWAQAGHAFAIAAERLRSRVRRDEEAKLLEEAVACFEATDEHEARSDALLHLFRCHWDRKYRAGIREVAATMRQVARSPTARMWAAFSRAMLATDERPDDASLALAVQAREAAEDHARDTGLQRPLAQMLVWEATVHAILNHVDEALSLGRRVDALMDALPHDRWRGHLHYNLGFTFEVCGGLAEGLAHFDQAERIFVELDEPVHIADTRSMSSITLSHLGRLGEAIRRLEAGRRMWAEMNGGRAEPHTSDVYIARHWRDAGRLGPAVALLEDTVERAARIADVSLQGWAAGELGGLFILLGQPARAGRLLEMARASPKPHVRFDGLLGEARLARALGQSPDGALAAAQALVPQCMRTERMGWLLDVERSRSMPAPEAAALMRANFEAASAMGAWIAAAPSHAMWVDALTRAGDVQGAVAQARALAGSVRDESPALERPPMSLYPAEYWLILLRAFEAAGDEAAAREALARGVAWVREVVLPGLPNDFHSSFLQGNPVNRALLARAAPTA